MAAISPTNAPQRHVLGDLVIRFYDLSGNNGDTFTDLAQVNLRDVVITPTTAIAVGATWAGSVITFTSIGAWAARVAVFSRQG